MVFEVLANLWMPLCADFQVAVVHLADFFHMLLSATFTKLTKASLIMSANYWAIMHGQSDISEVTGVGSGLHLQIYFRFLLSEICRNLHSDKMYHICIFGVQDLLEINESTPKKRNV